MAEETQQARANRELIELLNELRVALPGVQVLFAFLLAVPFQQRFHLATSFQRNAYFVTLTAALVATGLLIAPSAYHRVNFRLHNKERIVQFANRCVLAGIAVLAVAMVSVMVLISDVVFGTVTEILIPALCAVLLIVLWLVLPLRERSRALSRSARARQPPG